MQDYRKYIGAGDRMHLEMQNGYDKHQYASQIVDYYHDSGVLDVLTPVQKSRIVYFADGSVIKMVVPKGEAIYELEVRVLEKVLGQIPMMRLQIVSEMKKIQRRNFYRLRIIHDVSIRRVINPTEKKFGEKQKGVMLDISAGGLLLSSSTEFDERDIIEMTLNLIAGKPLVLFGKIVRKQFNNNAKIPYEYGVQFEKISDFERNEITKFIFEEQRKLIKKGLV